MNPVRPYHRRGFTLLELAASIAVMSVLMGGLASAILLASHAMPDREGPFAATVEGAELAGQIAGELYCARSFTERTSTSVEFAVADRDNDTNLETIRYYWSGTPGDPLTREYNGSGATPVVPAIYEFDLAYDTASIDGSVKVLAVRIALRVSSDASTRVETAIQMLNQPDASG